MVPTIRISISNDAVLEKHKPVSSLPTNQRKTPPSKVRVQGVVVYCCTVVLLYCCCALPLLCIAGLTLLLLFARRKRHFGWFGISQFEFGRFFVFECHHSSIFGTCSLGDWGSGRSFECFLFEATGRLLLPWFATALWYLNTRRWTTHLFLFSCFLVFVVCLFVCSGGTRLWRPTLFVPVPVHCCRICCEARHCNL